ncbi:Siderophore iron transporter mirB [Talaromyces atroroseus]|uniref:Siderophore iron transporter mirB n=1 Tax=Talaromyces atroroseus TaxID=1441469 RepID=A0A1Q5QAV6_TALAT|nr:Siderophore iron transporter mirB [Talaromyces atroroseus]OKL63065.1 Siderophore iron transporter mirB [Talaromyces atroroseus]
MPVVTKILGALHRASSIDEPSAPVTTTTVQEKNIDPASIESTAGTQEGDGVQQEPPSEGLQRGVREAEALALTWSRGTLIAVFCNIWMIYLVDAFQESTLDNLVDFITSDFSAQSLLNVIYVVGYSTSAAVFIPLSKIMDVWGRANGFLFMAFFCTLGLVLMACSTNISVFCAAYTANMDLSLHYKVFYSIGFSGITYCVDVITADSSKLRNRGLAYAFTSSPYIITAFAGPKVAEEFNYDISWEWAFGCWSIIFPFAAAPLYFTLRHNLGKAKKNGLLVNEKSGRTLIQSIWYYAIEFDTVGVFLFTAGLIIFLIPFDIASSAPNGWATGYIIAMIVVGFVLLILFGTYEWKVAPKPMFDFRFLSDRTVVAACLLDVTYQVSYYCWDNYFTSFLIVVNDLTITTAGYVNNTFDVVSGVLLLFVGWLIRRTGRFKWLLYIAVPLYIFAQGLMIYFRRPNQSVGYLVMCQIFISIGGSVFIIIEQLAILAAVDHQHVAAALALLNVVGGVGGALGGAISGAIWSNTYGGALYSYLPESQKGNYSALYDDINAQISFPTGSPTRLAIQEAYGYGQTRMLAAGTGVMGLSLIWIFFFRDINVGKVAQVKGTVF